MARSRGKQAGTGLARTIYEGMPYMWSQFQDAMNYMNDMNNMYGKLSPGYGQSWTPYMPKLEPPGHPGQLMIGPPPAKKKGPGKQTRPKLKQGGDNVKTITKKKGKKLITLKNAFPGQLFRNFPRVIGKENVTFGLK